MVAGCQRAPTDARRLQHFKRHGVDHICGYPGNEDDPASWSVESLTRLRELCESHGVALDMVQFPTLSSASIDRLSAQHAANPQRTSTSGKAIMLGKDPERQQEIDAVCAIIRNCAKVGIPAAKYNMNLLGVLRTPDTPGRGGSHYSTWRLREAKEDPPLTAAGVVPADDGLGAHHVLPRARRAGRGGTQGPPGLPPARPRRPAEGLPRRRACARHRRRHEAVRGHQGQPVSRPQPVPGHDGRDAAAARRPRSTTSSATSASAGRSSTSTSATSAAAATTSRKCSRMKATWTWPR